jgi:hypothetical protein
VVFRLFSNLAHDLLHQAAFAFRSNSFSLHFYL